MNHTPGPWQIHPSYQNPTILTTESEPHVSFCETYISQGDKIVAEAQMQFGGAGGWPRVESRSEMLANARLIASAPCLLEALEMALESLEALAVPQEWDCREKVREAIAKARGQS